MVNPIYDVLANLSNRPELFVSERTLRALQDFLSGYQTAVAFSGIQFDSEGPPFRHFAGWVERAFGRVIVDAKTGRFLGSTKNCFTMLTEEYGDSEQSFRKFFVLLDDFRRRRSQVLGMATLSVADQRRLSDSVPGITQFLATQYLPENGVYLIGQSAKTDFDVGYFNTMENVHR